MARATPDVSNAPWASVSSTPMAWPAARKVVIEAARGPQPVNCEVGRFRFSGHSHRRDLIQLVEQLRPRTVVLVHGETDARTWLADNIRFFYPDVTVHLIAMNDNGAFESSRAFWEDPALGVASIRTITSFGRDEVARAVAAILSIETGQQVTAT